MKPLSDARTKLEDFFNILPGLIGNEAPTERNAWTRVWEAVDSYEHRQ